ncbi:hypothetical protein [Planctomicrobium piriforme]|uniref:hypothetical protein n=1 Tax=Planctomicrobium piriforme TaxID=1576369 RepID=UPI001113DF4D|nr:hypothetical protein [Planctomicrobium piriforme]
MLPCLHSGFRKIFRLDSQPFSPDGHKVIPRHLIQDIPQVVTGVDGGQMAAALQTDDWIVRVDSKSNDPSLVQPGSCQPILNHLPANGPVTLLDDSQKQVTMAFINEKVNDSGNDALMITASQRGEVEDQVERSDQMQQVVVVDPLGNRSLSVASNGFDPIVLTNQKKGKFTSIAALREPADGFMTRIPVPMEAQ